LLEKKRLSAYSTSVPNVRSKDVVVKDAMAT
jgi:hypothetical protein